QTSAAARDHGHAAIHAYIHDSLLQNFMSSHRAALRTPARRLRLLSSHVALPESSQGRKTGMDPYRFGYSPIVSRPKLTWPNNAKVAVWVCPNIEHYEYVPAEVRVRNPWPRMPH